MMKSILLSSTFLFMVLALTAQESSSLNLDGTERTFTYLVPGTLPANTSVPLVFVLHGTTQTGNGIMDITHFNDLADAHQFIVVYPDGVGNAWNVGLGAAGSTADDLGFINALVDWFNANYLIDETRVFSCGFSAGGYMSYRLACESEHCFAAVASVGGTMNEGMVDACNPLYSSSVLCIHGTSDFVVSYNGSSISGNSVGDVMSFWSSMLACDPDPVMETLPNTAPFDFSTVERYTYNNCLNGSELIHLKVVGGGHQWPGTDALLGGIGTINQDISASEEIWDFFSSKSCSTETQVEVLEQIAPVVYPNPARDFCSILHYQGKNYQLVDVTGKVIFSDTYTGTLDLSSLISGIYIIKGENGFQQKLVIY